MQAREGAAVEDGLHRAGEAPQLTLEWSSQGLEAYVLGAQGWGILWHGDRQCCKKNELVHRPDHLVASPPRACCQAPGLSLPSGLPWLCCSAGLCSWPLGSRQCLGVACVQAVAVSGE